MSNTIQSASIAETHVANIHADVSGIVREGVVGIVGALGDALFGEVGCESAIGAEISTFVIGVIRIRNLFIYAFDHTLPVGRIRQVNIITDVGTKLHTCPIHYVRK